MMKRPNVIYILTDDQRHELLGCAGHPFLQTPNLDQLATEGTRFSRAYCTSPLCTPSRVSHYTGQWERRHGVNFNSGTPLSESAWNQTFVGELKKAGYFTAWIGKNHVPVGEGGYKSGFMEEWFDCWYGNHNHSTFYPKELPEGRGEIYQQGSHDTQPELFAEAALNVLTPQSSFMDAAPSTFHSRPDEQPFCMCLTFNLPHGASCSTMRMRPQDDEMYGGLYRDCFDQIDMPETWKAWKQSYRKLPEEVYNTQWIPDYDYVKTEQDLKERIIRQCQAITGIDRVIGELRTELEAIGEAENTIIVFSTDHGLMFGEHGLGGKALLYEQALRIPLIIYDPRSEVRPGSICDTRVSVPDLAPTVMDLCGLEANQQMQGRSLKPFMNGGSLYREEDFFFENLFDEQNYPRCEGVIHGQWKYIRYYARTNDPAKSHLRLQGTLDDYHECRLRDSESPVYEELYDLNADPQEIHNLIPSMADQSLLSMMRECCQETCLKAAR